MGFFLIIISTFPFFIRYHPTAEDVETYKQFKDTPHELETTDQFMMQLCEIPNLKTRLDLLMIINDFPVAYNDLAPVSTHHWHHIITGW